MATIMVTDDAPRTAEKKTRNQYEAVARRYDAKRESKIRSVSMPRNPDRNWSPPAEEDR